MEVISADENDIKEKLVNGGLEGCFAKQESTIPKVKIRLFCVEQLCDKRKQEHYKTAASFIMFLSEQRFISGLS